MYLLVLIAKKRCIGRIGVCLKMMGHIAEINKFQEPYQNVTMELPEYLD